jgi:hypothetical protein
LTGAMDMAAELRRSKAKRRRWDEEEDEIVLYLLTMDDSSLEKSDESQEFLTILREEQIRRKYEDQLYRKEQMEFRKEDNALNTIKVIGDSMRALESQSGGKDTETYSQLERIYNKALDILEK